MTLTAAEVAQLKAFNDQLSMNEVEEIYLPLSRLLSFYVGATQKLFRDMRRFLGTEDVKVALRHRHRRLGRGRQDRPPRACCRRCSARWPNTPKVDLITTDGFLLPNAVLEREGLMEKKGFPESYDLPALLRFLTDVKAGTPSGPRAGL